MISPPYSSLAACYDKLNAHIPYDEWALRISEKLSALGVQSGALVLDLACGTGNITIPLAERGYDMIGIDLSPDMLNAAKDKPGADQILWLCQDMRSFELYGTVGAVVCCLDSINYLTGNAGLKKCFSLVHNYLDPSGIFLFDVNSPYKFSSVYGDRHYIMEADGVYCGWQNHYDRKSGLCDFELSIFAEENGLYRRYNEYQRERCYQENFLRKRLTEQGFQVISVTADWQGNPVTPETERLFFACRAIKS